MVIGIAIHTHIKYIIYFYVFYRDGATRRALTRPVNQSPIERVPLLPPQWTVSPVSGEYYIHPISRYVRLISETIRNPFTVPWKSDRRTMRQLYFVIALVYPTIDLYIILLYRYLFIIIIFLAIARTLIISYCARTIYTYAYYNDIVQVSSHTIPIYIISNVACVPLRIIYYYVLVNERHK